MYKTSPIPTDLTENVIADEASGEPWPAIVIISPSAKFLPPSVIETEAVDEPSSTSLNVAFEPELADEPSEAVTVNDETL